MREVEGSPGRFTFVHALIRHTIYDELGPARRVELHRRVAETLESLGGGDAYLSDLAHHWVAATPATGVWADDVAKSVSYAEQAGRRAMGHGRSASLPSRRASSSCWLKSGPNRADASSSERA